MAFAQKLAIFVYGFAAYALSMYVFVSTILFVGNLAKYVPADVAAVFPAESVDGDPEAAALPITTRALLGNAALILLFGVQHLCMARAPFKKLVTRVVPWQMERTNYCVATSACLYVLIKAWTPLATPVFAVADHLVPFVWGLHLFGWAFATLATFCIDHFELFGVKQVCCFDDNATSLRYGSFVTRGLYRIVRHPIMTGFLTGFWATPVYTVGRLEFNILMSAFVFYTVTFYEEPDLEKSIGAPYVEYMETTPAYLPGLCPVTRRRGKCPAAAKEA